MKSSGKKINLTMCFLAIIIFTVFVSLGANDLPGADAPEGFPNGCIDCHSQTANDDFRLKTILGEKEDHPSISKIVNNVPTDCLLCHKAGSYGGDLKSLMHKEHLESKSDDGFAKNYGTNCLICHSEMPKEGFPYMKTAPKNW